MAGPRFKSEQVKRFLQSEIGAAVLWLLGSLVLAAVVSPWIHQAGKWLAEVAETRELPGMIEWLAAACGRAKFGRFYDRALLFSAVLLIPLLFRRIRSVRAAGGALRVPEMARWGWRSGAMQLAVGCVLAGGLLWGLCVFLHWSGANEAKAAAPGAGRLLSKVMVPALGASLVEECLFRGLLLGLWLRFARPLAACTGSAILFAFLHFLNPPPGTVIADPGHPLAGFQLLGAMLMHFAEPRFFITDFATLLAVGLMLAWARLRTGALWFPIGLHAGWIMAFKACGMFYQKVQDHPLRPWGVGDNLRSGLLPLVTLVATACLCHYVLRRFDPLIRASR